MNSNTEQLIVILASSEINKCIDFSGVRIKTSMSVRGCDGCVFETEHKANGCTYKSVCMAHLRKDRMSVIFANGIEE